MQEVVGSSPSGSTTRNAATDRVCGVSCWAGQYGRNSDQRRIRPSALDELNEVFGEEAGELIGRVVAEHNAGHQQNVQAAEKMLGSKVGMPPQPRDPATQQFVAKPPMTDEQRLDARDNEILDEILGTDDESEFGDEAPGEAQSEDAVLDQILDGKMTPEAQRRRGMDAAERRRQAGYSAVDGVGRVGMKPRENPGFEIMR